MTWLVMYFRAMIEQVFEREYGWDVIAGGSTDWRF